MSKTTKQPAIRRWHHRLVRLFAVGAEGFADIIVWVPRIWIRNVFLISPEVGPFGWLLLLVTLPVAPAIALGCAVAESVLRMDDYCKSNVKGLAPATGSASPPLVEVCHHPPNPTRNG